MTRTVTRGWYSLLFLTTTAFTLGWQATLKAQQLYRPIPLANNHKISDALSDQDIPTGEGGFARDYLVNLQEGDQVAIDLISEEFDTIVTLIARDGTTVAENDDGPDGSTNSLLFARITETADYIVRVGAFGETGGGTFNLKVTRLRPIVDSE